MQIDTVADAYVALAGLTSETNGLIGRMQKLREHGGALERRGSATSADELYLKRETRILIAGFRRVKKTSQQVVTTLERRLGIDHPDVARFRQDVETLL